MYNNVLSMRLDGYEGNKYKNKNLLLFLYSFMIVKPAHMRQSLINLNLN